MRARNRSGRHAAAGVVLTLRSTQARRTAPLDKLEQQLIFLREIDRLKTITRQSPLLDRTRKENSAEHSWHLALYALVLSEYAHGSIDAHRVMQMLLLHDIVEIDVGDFPIHGGASPDVQAEQEARAAARIFGLLPLPQRREFLDLWQEFEQAETEDAKFAKALDRFQPLLTNVFTDGGTWKENGVSLEQVLARYGPAIARGAPQLWAVCERWVFKHFQEQR
ncbi:HD domain-containing protein [Achromobacter denitrificans]|nr:HD domain-containing protein [Achromobacter denitrificans]RSE88288.1 HD domain-containing protein [Achromobacter denitrificans]WFC68855.1 HD domain-containing protein [Achromobacter denitrificans]